MLTLELMLHESHWVILLASAHGLDARAETRDGQDDNIADLLGCLHAGEVFPGDVPLAGAHIKVVWIVEIRENGVGPDGWASELDYAFVVLAKSARLLAVEGLLGDVCDDVDKYRMAWLGLDGPLAELDAARVPLSPVWPVWISLDANDHAVGICRHILGNPVGCTLQGRCINVRVDAASRQ